MIAEWCWLEEGSDRACTRLCTFGSMGRLVSGGCFGFIFNGAPEGFPCWLVFLVAGFFFSGMVGWVYGFLDGELSWSNQRVQIGSFAAWKSNLVVTLTVVSFSFDLPSCSIIYENLLVGLFWTRGPLGGILGGIYIGNLSRPFHYTINRLSIDRPLSASRSSSTIHRLSRI